MPHGDQSLASKWDSIEPIKREKRESIKQLSTCVKVIEIYQMRIDLIKEELGFISLGFLGEAEIVYIPKYLSTNTGPEQDRTVPKASAKHVSLPSTMCQVCAIKFKSLPMIWPGDGFWYINKFPFCYINLNVFVYIPSKYFYWIFGKSKIGI